MKNFDNTARSLPLGPFDGVDKDDVVVSLKDKKQGLEKLLQKNEAMGVLDLSTRKKIAVLEEELKLQELEGNLKELMGVDWSRLSIASKINMLFSGEDNKVPLFSDGNKQVIKDELLRTREELAASKVDGSVVDINVDKKIAEINELLQFL